MDGNVLAKRIVCIAVRERLLTVVKPKRFVFYWLNSICCAICADRVCVFPAGFGFKFRIKYGSGSDPGSIFTGLFGFGYEFLDPWRPLVCTLGGIVHRKCKIQSFNQSRPIWLFLSYVQHKRRFSCFCAYNGRPRSKTTLDFTDFHCMGKENPPWDMHEVIQVWNSMRLSKWWYDFNFWEN